MSNRILRLQMFEINDYQEYIDMWTDIDSDYEEHSDYPENSAKDEVKKLFDEWNGTDLKRLDTLMDMITDGIGDYYGQFSYETMETDDHKFYVAVAFLN